MRQIVLPAALAALVLGGCGSPNVEAAAPGTVVGVAPGRIHGPYVPAGAELTIALQRSVSTRSVTGEPFTAKVESPLADTNGTVLVPQGATLWGHVVSTSNGRSPHLVLSFDSVQTTSGLAPLIAKVVDIQPASTPTDQVYGSLLASPRTPQEPQGVPVEAGRAATRDIIVPPGAHMRLELTRPLFPPGTAFGR